MQYITRTLESFLAKAIKQFPVLLLTGPRQVGKTTLLKHLSNKNYTYVTLDDPSSATLAKEEPALFLQRFQPPVLIDEIQYAPELLPHIKIWVDKEQTKGMFWLTGSQPFHLMQGISESLAGRVGIVNLLGLSLKELYGQANLAKPFLPTHAELLSQLATAPTLSLREIYQIIWRGSYPAMWSIETSKEQFATPRYSDVDRDLFYSSYLQTYLQRDVRNLANVGDETAFLKFLRATAARTGQLLNLTEMARDVGISVPTAKRWLSILETSSIVYLLEPFHSNINSRLIKSPKLYFLDTGLCAYLTEWSTPETLEAGAMSGAILETFIFTEILKSYWYNGKRAPLYFYRDKDKREIDLLIYQDGTLFPLEFKKTANPTKNSIQHFKVLEQLSASVANGGVICLSQTLMPITKNANAIPIGLI